MTCVFCDIVAGDAPAAFVPCSTQNVTAFVPLSPVTPGHLLFVPRRHVADAAADPWLTGWVTMAAAEHARRRGVPHNLLTSTGAAATQSIRHLHIHYVPRAEDDGLMLPWGTAFGEDPKAPHRCRRVVELEQQLLAAGPPT